MELQPYKNIPDHNIATYIRTYVTTYNSNLVEHSISWIFLELAQIPNQCLHL